MNGTKKFGQSQKLINLKDSNHRPKDVANSHMGTYLVEFNDVTCWILKVKTILKMFENHAWRTTTWQMRDAQKFRPKKVHRKFKFWIKLKSNKESKQGEYVSSGCKANNAITISKDVKIGARTLAICVNSLTHPKAKFPPIQHVGRRA
jgi:hypothetical protein